MNALGILGLIGLAVALYFYIRFLHEVKEENSQLNAWMDEENHPTHG